MNLPPRFIAVAESVCRPRFCQDRSCRFVVRQTVNKLCPVRQTKTQRIVVVISSTFRAPLHNPFECYSGSPVFLISASNSGPSRRLLHFRSAMKAVILGSG